MRILGIWGDKGTGKTSSIFTMNSHLGINEQFDPPLYHWDSKNIYLKRGLGKWFDGYIGQEVLVLDDILIKDVEEARSLLAILDRFTFRIETKGSHRMSEWRHVVITSNVPPHEWFNSSDRTIPFATQGAILDRISRETQFTGDSHRDENRPLPWLPTTS